MEISPYKYTKNYCEENIWHLCQHPELAGFVKKVLFVSSTDKNCAFHFQKDSVDGAPVWWDYHVILYVSKNNTELIFDLDSSLNQPTPFQDYLRLTFQDLEGKKESSHPIFKAIDSEDYITGFFSDRKHMQNGNGEWIFEPPLWPIIADNMVLTLQELMDFTQTSHQPIYSLETLVAKEYFL
jgi:protein N-terminal glutamine amidohydrolase